MSSLTKRAAGQWRAIYASCAPELAEAIAMADRKPRGHVACPVHGTEGSADGFRLFEDWQDTGGACCNTCGSFCGGVQVLQWLTGESFRGVASMVERVIGKDEDWAPDPDAEKNKLRLRKIQDEAKKAGPLVSAYLQSRGLEVPPGLYEAELAYFEDGKATGKYQAMLGKFVSPSGKPVTWHITYLHGASKAPVSSARKIMPAIDADEGGAIRLYPAQQELGIAEGIETAIAAKLLFGVPVWAAMNAENLAKFRPPENVRKLYIFGDSDPSCTGQACAYTLARRLYRRIESREVVLPSTGDWADELLRQRRAA
jgi:putative DNA primase/helicase